MNKAQEMALELVGHELARQRGYRGVKDYLYCRARSRLHRATSRKVVWRGAANYVMAQLMFERAAK